MVVGRVPLRLGAPELKHKDEVVIFRLPEFQPCDHSVQLPSSAALWVADYPDTIREAAR